MANSDQITIRTRLHESQTSVVARGDYGGKPAILKQLKADHADSRTVAAFRFEYALLKELESEHIVRPLAQVQVDGTPVQVLEDIGGESIHKIADGRPLPVADVLFIAIGIAKALGLLQARQIIHKDLSPHNVVVNLRARRVQLIDFGIATRLSRETQGLQPLAGLEGTLLYMSPEQTGRMNRSIDYRTDFYSLGATLYEALTGRPPCQGADLAETVHLILASMPTPVRALRPEVPEPLAGIVMRLLEKAPESRYASAYGLEHDLRRCADELAATGAVAPFALGALDRSERLEVSERLYGREDETRQLAEIFARAAAGAGEVVLIPGPSGIGKSAFVNELRKPLVRHRGLFVAGKFDQFKRNVPLYAVTQACNQLVQSLLRETPERVQAWRSQILAAVGSTGDVLIDVVPALVNLIGPQPKAPQLEPDQSRARLLGVFDRFIRAIASRDCPLVLFLDDVQWADGSSLAILEALGGEGGPSHLMTIVSYRDNEVSSDHPVMMTLAKLEKSRARLSRIAIPAMATAAVGSLVADTLRCPPAACADLTEVVARKTNGNPLFIKTFLRHLADDGLLRFDRDAGRWVWETQKIVAQKTTDNVVDLLLAKLQSLAAKTSRSLTYAACIGPRFDLKTLALLLEERPLAVAQDLWPAVQEGYVAPIDGDYKLLLASATYTPAEAEASAGRAGGVVFMFSHDRVQQAAHELMPAEQRGRTHYRMGKILRASLTPAEQSERIFDIVDHLNHGAALAAAAAEREDLARLNVAAAGHALSANAYAAAISYYRLAESLLGPEAWAQHYEDAKALHLGLARSYHASDQFEEGRAILDGAIEAMRTAAEKAMALEVLASMLEAQARYRDCVTTCLRGMALLGFRISQGLTPLRLVKEAMLLHLVHKRSLIDHLARGGKTNDDAWMALAGLANRALPSAYLMDPNFAVVLTLKLLRRAKQLGVAVAHPTFTIILSQVLMILRDRRSALRVRDIAYEQLAVSETMPIETLFHVVAGHWCDVIDQPLAVCVEKEDHAYVKGLELGDPGNAGVSAFLSLLNAMGAGFRLPEILAKGEGYTPFFAKTTGTYGYSFFFSVLQTARCFAGATTGEATMTDAAITEPEIAAAARVAPGNTCMYNVMRSWIDFHAGSYQEAFRRAVRNPVQLRLPGCFSGAINMAIIALSVLRSRAAGTPVVSRLLGRLIVLGARLELRWWDQSYAGAGKGLVDLVAAEAARARGAVPAALAAYQRAIGKFRALEAWYWLATAHEALGRLYLALGQELAAAAHLREAGIQFELFGAAPAAARLQQEFPAWLQSQAGPAATSAARGTLTTTHSGGTVTGSSIDLESIVKASHAISSQMDLGRLVHDLLHVVMENAGATYGAMLMLTKDRPELKVTGRITGAAFAAALVDAAAPADAAVPASVVQYVQRRGAELLLNSAKECEDYGADPYFQAKRPKAVVCLPVTAHGNAIAIVYLENDLVEGAFTQERLRTLRILSAQGAISLRNAGYVHELQASSARIAALKGQLETILAGTKEMAASRSAEAALAIAVNTMRREIARCREASCSALITDRSTGKLALYPVLADGRVDWSRAADRDGAAEAWAPFLASEGLTVAAPAAAVVPTRWQEETLGLLIFEGMPSADFTPEERSFAETLSQSLGLSLKNIDHQEHLETLVAERTLALRDALAEMTVKQQKIQAIMDHIDQGILTFDASLAIEAEFSAHLPRILRVEPGAVGGREVVASIFGDARLGADNLAKIREVLRVSLGEDVISWELNGSALPRELEVGDAGGERTLALGWNPMMDPAAVVRKMLLTVRDITDQRRLERAVREHEAQQSRRMAAVAKLLGVERSHLARFFGGARQLLSQAAAELARPAPEWDRVSRDLHTFKGDCRALKLTDLATLVHQAETPLQGWQTETDGPPPAAAVAAALGEAQAAFAELDQVYQEVFAGGAAAPESWSVFAAAGYAYPQTVSMARAAGLTLARFDVTDQVGEWPAELRDQVQLFLMHGLSNALDHGYILPHREGRSVAPVDVEIAARAGAGEVIEIEIRDRGVGFDLGKIQRLAERLGRVDLFLRDPAEVLFEAGSSTAANVTLTSGRGVGLKAIRHAARELGGEATLAARPGGGAVLRIRLPRHAAGAGSRTAA